MVQHPASTGLTASTAPEQGHYYVDFKTGQVAASQSAYEHPQPHACFIQSVSDDLVNDGGIMDLWVREARLFKYGSGTGSNFSLLRGQGEQLSGGGKSSGLMSFLKIGDRAAGAIKSGGTTRRAAKMVVVDIDHPDIEEYINWKVREEQKVAALVTGSKVLSQHLKAILKACINCDGPGESCFDPAKNSRPEKGNPGRQESAGAGKLRPAGRSVRPPGLHRYRLSDLRHRLGFGSLSHRPPGQNSNNSVRVTDDFLDTVGRGGKWKLNGRISGRVTREVDAGDLWEQIGNAAWQSADPGIQFHTTINDWHTCPKSGAIRASNPCSEYMFLDDTACNLASLNLMQFRGDDGNFDVGDFEHAVRLWTTVLEISVLMAQFPSFRIAQLSYQYRTLGLGYANIGGLLMASGTPYDSPEGRSIAAGITALMTRGQLCDLSRNGG